MATRDDLIKAAKIFRTIDTDGLYDDCSVPQHPDDVAVNCFADAMKARLAEKRKAGYGGWQDPNCVSATELSDRLLSSLFRKGDTVDVANLAMMLHQRCERICPSKSEEAAGTPQGPIRRIDWQTVIDNNIPVMFVQYEGDDPFRGFLSHVDRYDTFGFVLEDTTRCCEAALDTGLWVANVTGENPWPEGCVVEVRFSNGKTAGSAGLSWALYDGIGAITASRFVRLEAGYRY